MIISILTLWVISVSLALVVSTTPLMLGIWVLIMAFSISILMSAPMSSLFSFVIFLIYIGSLLVMFAYFIAIDPNKKINIIDPILIPMIIISTIYATTLKLNSASIMSFSMTPFINLSALLMSANLPLFISLTIILLIAMIIVVKVASRKEGPLRPFK